jgi:hypothetical protein
MGKHLSRAYLEGLTKTWGFGGSSAPLYSPFCTLKKAIHLTPCPWTTLPVPMVPPGLALWVFLYPCQTLAGNHLCLKYFVVELQHSRRLTFAVLQSELMCPSVVLMCCHMQHSMETHKIRSRKASISHHNQTEPSCHTNNCQSSGKISKLT